MTVTELRQALEKLEAEGQGDKTVIYADGEDEVEVTDVWKREGPEVLLR